jgi:hypothetical protein
MATTPAARKGGGQVAAAMTIAKVSTGTVAAA